MRIAIPLLTALVLMLPLAAQSISADRPGFADGPDITSARFQIETGLSLDGDSDELLLPTLLRFGINDALEIRVESDILEPPVAAGIKLRLLSGDVPVSLIASVSTDKDGEVRLTSNIDLGGGFSLTPNAGVALAESEDAELVLAATLEKDAGNLAPFVDVEVHGTGGDHSGIVDGGIAWVPRPDTQLDLSGGFRFTGEDYPEWFVSAGISRRF